MPNLGPRRPPVNTPFGLLSNIDAKYRNNIAFPHTSQSAHRAVQPTSSPAAKTTTTNAAKCQYQVPSKVDRTNFYATVGQPPGNFTSDTRDNRSSLQTKTRFANEVLGGITPDASFSDGVALRAGAQSSEAQANKAWRQSTLQAKHSRPASPLPNPNALPCLTTPYPLPSADLNPTAALPQSSPLLLPIHSMGSSSNPPINSTLPAPFAELSCSNRPLFYSAVLDPTHYLPAIPYSLQLADPNAIAGLQFKANKLSPANNHS